VVPADDLLSEATALAEGIAAKSLPSVFAAKAALDAAMETTLSEGLDHEKQAFAALFDTADQKEGMAAFREKRQPDFRNR
jgi:enoyl-CoA hydratase